MSALPPQKVYTKTTVGELAACLQGLLLDYPDAVDAEWLCLNGGSLIVYLAKGRPEHVIIGDI